MKRYSSAMREEITWDQYVVENGKARVLGGAVSFSEDQSPDDMEDFFQRW